MQVGCGLGHHGRNHRHGDAPCTGLGHVDVRGGDAPFCKSGLGSFHGQIAAGHSLFDDVALADTGAFDDPLVRGFYHLFQIFVGEQARRDVGSQGADFGA